MSFFNSILKFFVGDKTKKDIKSILPIVEDIKSFESQISKLNNDELREEVYNKICDATIMEYKTDNLGIDDIELSSEPVPEG